MILYGHDENVAEWAARLLGKPFHPPFTTIGSLAQDGTLNGAYVFTGYNGHSVEFSMAGRGTMRREIWGAVLTYVFDQMKCSRLQAHTAASNKIVRTALPRLGFRFEGKCRKFYGKEDALMFSLIADEVPGFRARWRI